MGLPTWSSIAIVCAALITGALLSVMNQNLGLPFLLCFAVAGISVALMTEVRGLFITVAALPVLFALGAIGTSYWITRLLAADGAPAFNKTTLVTAVYPLVEFFPWLLGVTLSAIIIGYIRFSLFKRNTAKHQKQFVANRREIAEADRRNRENVAKARSRTFVGSAQAKEKERDHIRRRLKPQETRANEGNKSEQSRSLDDNIYGENTDY